MQQTTRPTKALINTNNRSVKRSKNPISGECYNSHFWFLGVHTDKKNVVMGESHRQTPDIAILTSHTSFLHNLGPKYIGEGPGPPAHWCQLKLSFN